MKTIGLSRISVTCLVLELVTMLVCPGGHALRYALDERKSHNYVPLLIMCVVWFSLYCVGSISGYCAMRNAKSWLGRIGCGLLALLQTAGAVLLALVIILD